MGAGTEFRESESLPFLAEFVEACEKLKADCHQSPVGEPGCTPAMIGGLDWWSGVAKFDGYEWVGHLMSWLGRKWSRWGDIYWAESKSRFRGKSYRQIFTSPLGIEIAWDTDDCGKIECRCEIKGSALGVLSPSDGARIIENLVLNWSFKTSRVDIKCDIKNMGGLGILQNVSEAAQTGNYTKFHQSREIKPRLRSGKLLGWTIYFGSAKSTRQVRWYHKGLERKTGADWIRCEAQYRGDCAELLLGQIFTSKPATTRLEPMEWISNLCSEIALKATEFRERDNTKSGHYSLRDLPLCDWFEALLSKIPTVSVRFKLSEKKPISYRKTVSWLQRQVFGVLGTVAEYSGLDWVISAIKDAQKNMSDGNLARFSAWLAEEFARDPILDCEKV